MFVVVGDLGEADLSLAVIVVVENLVLDDLLEISVGYIIEDDQEPVIGCGLNNSPIVDTVKSNSFFA